MIRYSLAVLLFLVGSYVLASQKQATANPSYDAVPVVTDLEHPWGMALLPDGGILITERPGRLRLFRNGALLAPVAGLPAIATGGQGGLLDVALHPDHANNSIVYLSYSKPVPGGQTTALLMADLSIETNSLKNPRDIFIARPAHHTRHHYGSRIVFGKDGTLYLSIGDRGNSDQAQSLATHMGKVVRLHPDGSIPADNPFVDRTDALAEIFSYGHRNPQGMTSLSDGAIWLHEHGPRGGDEINLLVAGANYGWPVVTHGRSYSDLPIGEGSHKAGMQQPLWYWVPSIAPSGMVFYQGGMFPELRGDLLVGSLKFRYIERLSWRDSKLVTREMLVKNSIGRIRDLELGADGAVYVLNDEANGGVYRLTASEN